MRDAPIFEEEHGILSVRVSVVSPSGEAIALCSVVPRRAQIFEHAMGGVSLRGDEVLALSCRSFHEKTGRVRGGGCAVGVNLWVRPP